MSFFGFLSHTSRVATPYVTLDRSRCEACWRCIEVCRTAVMGKAGFGPHRHAVVVDAAACTGCGRCLNECPSGALRTAKTATGAATV